MKCKSIVVFLLIFLPAALLHAQQPRIGFVNTAKILEEAPQAQAAVARLEREFEPRQKGITDALRSLQQLEQRAERDAQVMSEGERRRLERDIIARRREISRSRDEFNQDFNLRRNEELAKLQREVREIIIELAKSQNYDLILNDVAVIYVNERTDLTNQVLSRLR